MDGILELLSKVPVQYGILILCVYLSGKLNTLKSELKNVNQMVQSLKNDLLERVEEKFQAQEKICNNRHT